MHEYTIKEIDGVMWGHYQSDSGTFDFLFIDDADAQTQIDNYLTEVYIEHLKREYPDTWQEMLGDGTDVSLTLNRDLPIEEVEEI